MQIIYMIRTHFSSGCSLTGLPIHLILQLKMQHMLDIVTVVKVQPLGADMISTYSAEQLPDQERRFLLTVALILEAVTT